MRRLLWLTFGILLAAAGSAIATGSTPPGLPWVTATKQSKIKTNPSSAAAADASLLLDASSAGSGECMIGVDTATDVCLIDAEGDAAAASMAVVGTSSAATLSATTALTLEETGAGTDAITLQAPASITAAYSLTLPVDDGGAGEVLTTDGSGVLSWAAAAAGDITAVGSMTGGAVFADATATGDWLGLGSGAGRISFTDAATDVVSTENAYFISTNPTTALVAINSTGSVGSTRSMLQLVNPLDDTGWDFGYNISLSDGNFTIRSFLAGVPSTRFVIDDANGNTGIGSDSTPDTLLDVQGSFSAGTNGEMSVDTSGNITAIDVAVNGGDITTTASTMNLIPSAATAINIGTTTSADINIGDSSSTVDFGDTASAATAFLPDADLGANLGSSSLNFSETHTGSVYRGFHHAAGDTNYTIGANDYSILSDEHDTVATVKYVILPTCNSGQKGRTIEAVRADVAAGTTSICTPQDAACGATGTDSILSITGTTITASTLSFTKVSLTCDGSGVWHN